MEPGGRQPAPDELRLVQAFVNTNDIEAEWDELRGPEELRVWLVQHGLLAPEVTLSEADRQRALALREALRALLLANNDGPVDPAVVQTLNRIAADTLLRLQFDAHGRSALMPAPHGPDAALGRLLGIVYGADGRGHLDAPQGLPQR